MFNHPFTKASKFKCYTRFKEFWAFDCPPYSALGERATLVALATDRQMSKGDGYRENVTLAL